MIDYSIIYKGSSENKSTFYVELNSDKPREVYFKVFNQYLNYVEYESKLEMVPNVIYWNYVVSNSKNRYVEFRDSETHDVVGLFSLEGIKDMFDYDYKSYIKNIFLNLNKNVKGIIFFIINEIMSLEMYQNDFVFIEEGDIVIDIGFNYGLFSLEALKKNASKIISFEPNPNLVNTFNKFIDEDKIELHELAISDYNGKITFHENIYNGMSTIVDDVNTINNKDSYEVNVRNFYDFIIENNINKINYLKVDCEGSEYQVFNSIPDDYLKNNINKIAIETHHRKNNNKVINLINKLKINGFELYIKYEEENSTIGMIYAKK